MKRSNRLVILVGVLLAILAFVGIVVLLGNNAGPGTVAPTTVTVLVAKADIAIGDSVTPAMVSVKEVAPDAVSGTRFSDPSELTGKPALFPVAKDQQVSEELFGTTSNVCIACQLEPGEKAIAFQVDPVTGLDFLIQPGDHVDILYRTEITVLQPTADSAGSSNPRFEPIVGLEASPTVKTLLQNKRVLYVSGTKIKPATNPNATPAPGAQGTTDTPIASVIIVFAGSDADAELVKFAQNDNSVIGPLTAILRHTDDDVIETTSGITLKILIETFGIPIPEIIQVAAPPAP
ncbi:MAG: Flp pilus assembly protein CpaB [Chloroflexota bacterium]|nr:Flp pilus assembly protein CpaB [Chloroflexota bacterium]